MFTRVCHSILSQMNPVHHLTPYFFNINFNSFLLFTPRSLQVFWIKFCMHLTSPCRLHDQSISMISSPYQYLVKGINYETLHYAIVSILLFPLSFRSKYFPQHPFHKQHQFTFFPSDNKVSCPYRIGVKPWLYWQNILLPTCIHNSFYKICVPENTFPK